MKFDKDMVWNIILIVSVIMIVNGVSNSGDTDKKTVQAGQDQAAIGTVGAMASFIGKKQLVWGLAGKWVVTLILGGLALLPGFFKNTIDIFRPQPSIPSWIWIGGVLILSLMIFRKK